MLISGFGFSGWTKDPEKESKPKWTRAKNIDVLNVEFATSAAEIPKYWNIHVSVWLRYCILEKCRNVPICLKAVGCHIEGSLAV